MSMLFRSDFPKSKREEPHGFLKEDCLCENRAPSFLGVEEQRQMIAAISFPTVHIFLGNIFLSKDLSCHVIRRVDDKKEHKSDKVDTDEDWNGVKRAAYNVIEHL